MPRTRKMLHTTASGTENLVFRSSKRLKNQLSQERNIDKEAKQMVSKETQVNLNVTAEDLTNPEAASITYWQILAERRLTTINKLMEEIENLKQELVNKDNLLEEANSFVEVIKEELANASNNDTGIDVNDVSTLEDTVNDTNTVDDTADDTKELNASKDHE